jgi:hypothetical protein
VTKKAAQISSSPRIATPFTNPKGSHCGNLAEFKGHQGRLRSKIDRVEWSRKLKIAADRARGDGRFLALKTQPSCRDSEIPATSPPPLGLAAATVATASSKPYRVRRRRAARCGLSDNRDKRLWFARPKGHRCNGETNDRFPNVKACPRIT